MDKKTIFRTILKLIIACFLMGFLVNMSINTSFLVKNVVTASGCSHTYSWSNDSTYHFQKCTKCGIKINQSKHTWTMTSSKAATCKAAGYKKSKCTFSNCGRTKEETLSKLSHTWDSGVVTKAATCSAKGTKKFTCKICGGTKTEDIAKKAHTWDSGTVTKQATCKEAGSRTLKCRVCGASKAETIAKTTNHKWGSYTTTKAAQCEKDGQKQRTCSVCGKKETATIPKTGHSYGSWQVVKPATCKEAGSQKHTCLDCNKTETKAIAKLTTHTWGSWTVTTSPTCVKKGAKKRTCTVCGKAETADLAATGHSYDDGWQIITKATCTTDGKQMRVCSDCGAKEEKTISKTGHNYADATCTAPKTCRNCGVTTGNALGHNYVNGVCKNCGAKDPNSTTWILPTSISIVPSSLKLDVGKTSTLTTSYSPTTTSDKTVSWTSSNSGVASVSGTRSGSMTVTAKGPGTATITATHASGKKATCSITVEQPVTGISVSPSTSKLKVGETVTVNYTVSPSNATNKGVEITSNNYNCIKALGNNKYEAIAPGTATLTFKSKSNSNITAKATITVEGNTVATTGIKINKSKETIKVGNTTTLKATISPSNATNKTVIWKTEVPSIAQITAGQSTDTVTIKGISKGSTTITASNGGYSAQCIITVEDNEILVTKITAENSKGEIIPSIKEGEIISYTLKIEPSNAVNKDIVVSITNSENLKNLGYSNGVARFQGLKAGGASITFKNTRSGVSATYPISIVSKDVKIQAFASIKADSDKVEKGKKMTLTAVTIPADVTETISWSSDDTNIASVTKTGTTATVTGNNVGETFIVAKNSTGSISASYRLKVVSSTDLIGYELQLDPTDMRIGDSTTGVIALNPKDAKTSSIKWTTSDASVISISVSSDKKSCTLKAQKEGKATITTNVDGIVKTVTKSVVDKEKLTKFTFQSGSYEATVGEKKTIGLLFEPTNTGLNKNITLSSSNTKVATVSQGSTKASVVINPLTPGTTTISASCDGGKYIAKTIVTVVAKPNEKVTGIQVNPSSKSIKVGDSFTITYKILPENAGNKNIKVSVTNPSYININSTTVKGVKPGLSVVRIESAENSNIYGECIVVVDPKEEDVPVKSVSISGNSSVNVGSTITLTATVNPSNATNKTVYWKTEVPSIAQITAGQSTNKITLKGISAGKTVITASAGGMSTTKTIEVKDSTVKVTGITITGSTKVNVGQTIELKATVKPTNATNKKVIWTSSNNGYATVSGTGETGYVKGIAEGKVTIKATTEDGKFVASQSVTVAKPQEQVIKVTGLTISGGNTVNEGKQLVLTANLTPSNATNQNVIWKTSLPSVIRIEAGQSTKQVTLLAISEGTSTITATIDGISKSTTVRVQKDESKVSLSKTTMNLATNTEEELVLNGVSNGTYTWKSSNENIAKVSGTGYKVKIIAGKKAGEATISVNTGSKTLSCRVIVIENTIPVTGLNITDGAGAQVVVGTVGQLKAQVLPANASYRTVIWSSNNPNIVSIDSNSGRYTANTTGTVTITATCGTISKTTTISVFVCNPNRQDKNHKLEYTYNYKNINDETHDEHITCPICNSSWINQTKVKHKYNQNNNTQCVCGKKDPNAVGGNNIFPTGVKITNSKPLTMKVGEKVTLKATISPSNATTKQLYWDLSSSDSSKGVAKVGRTSGVVEALAPGQVTVWVTCGDVDDSIVINVVDKEKVKPTNIRLSETSITLNAGETRKLVATVLPSNATYTLDWISMNNKIATVNTQGLVTAVGSGVTDIYVDLYYTDSNNRKTKITTTSCEVNVNDFKVSSNEVTLANVKGNSATLDTKGQTIKAWESANTGVVTVNSGKITPKSSGTTHVYGYLDTKKTQKVLDYTVNVYTPNLDINKLNITRTVGAKLLLSGFLQGIPSNEMSYYTMTINPEGNGVISNGGRTIELIKATNKATISFYYKGKQISGMQVKLVIEDDPNNMPLTNISFTEKTLKLVYKTYSGADNPGVNLMNYIKIEPSDAKNYRLEFSPEYGKYYDVSANGMLTLKGVGSSTVSVKDLISGKTAKMSVEIKEDKIGVFSKAYINVGETLSISDVVANGVDTSNLIFYYGATSKVLKVEDNGKTLRAGNEPKEDIFVEVIQGTTKKPISRSPLYVTIVGGDSVGDFDSISPVSLEVGETLTFEDITGRGYTGKYYFFKNGGSDYLDVKKNSITGLKATTVADSITVLICYNDNGIDRKVSANSQFTVTVDGGHSIKFKGNVLDGNNEINKVIPLSQILTVSKEVDLSKVKITSSDGNIATQASDGVRLLANGRVTLKAFYTNTEGKEMQYDEREYEVRNCVGTSEGGTYRLAAINGATLQLPRPSGITKYETSSSSLTVTNQGLVTAKSSRGGMATVIGSGNGGTVEYTVNLYDPLFDTSKSSLERYTGQALLLSGFFKNIPADEASKYSMSSSNSTVGKSLDSQTIQLDKAGSIVITFKYIGITLPNTAKIEVIENPSLVTALALRQTSVTLGLYKEGTKMTEDAIASTTFDLVSNLIPTPSTAQIKLSDLDIQVPSCVSLSNGVITSKNATFKAGSSAVFENVTISLKNDKNVKVVFKVAVQGNLSGVIIPEIVKNVGETISIGEVLSESNNVSSYGFASANSSIFGNPKKNSVGYQSFDIISTPDSQDYAFLSVKHKNSKGAITDMGSVQVTIIKDHPTELGNGYSGTTVPGGSLSISEILKGVSDVNKYYLAPYNSSSKTYYSIINNDNTISINDNDNVRELSRRANNGNVVTVNIGYRKTKDLVGSATITILPKTEIRFKDRSLKIKATDPQEISLEALENRIITYPEDAFIKFSISSTNGGVAGITGNYIIFDNPGSFVLKATITGTQVSDQIPVEVEYPKFDISNLVVKNLDGLVGDDYTISDALQGIDVTGITLSSNSQAITIDGQNIHLNQVGSATVSAFLNGVALRNKNNVAVTFKVNVSEDPEFITGIKAVKSTITITNTDGVKILDNIVINKPKSNPDVSPELKVRIGNNLVGGEEIIQIRNGYIYGVNNGTIVVEVYDAKSGASARFTVVVNRKDLVDKGSILAWTRNSVIISKNTNGVNLKSFLKINSTEYTMDDVSFEIGNRNKKSLSISNGILTTSLNDNAESSVRAKIDSAGIYSSELIIHIINQSAIKLTRQNLVLGVNQTITAGLVSNNSSARIKPQYDHAGIVTKRSNYEYGFNKNAIGSTVTFLVGRARSANVDGIDYYQDIGGERAPYAIVSVKVVGEDQELDDGATDTTGKLQSGNKIKAGQTISISDLTNYSQTENSGYKIVIKDGDQHIASKTTDPVTGQITAVTLKSDVKSGKYILIKVVDVNNKSREVVKQTKLVVE